MSDSWLVGADSVQPAWDSVSRFLLPSPTLMHSLSLSLKINKRKKIKKKKPFRGCQKWRKSQSQGLTSHFHAHRHRHLLCPCVRQHEGACASLPPLTPSHLGPWEGESTSRLMHSSIGYYDKARLPEPQRHYVLEIEQIIFSWCR